MLRITTIFAGMLLAASSLSAQTVIVDNSGSGFQVLSQTWSTTSATGQYGADYRFRSTDAAASDVEWRPDLPTTGDYEVFVWYRNGNDRPSDATYQVNHAGGTTAAVVDQRLSGSQWVSLGTFPFAAGTTGHVTLSSAAEPGKSIVADAVLFSGTGANATAPELRACWLTQYQYLGKTEGQLRSIAQNIKSGGMNTVYVAMYAGQTVYWPSKAYKAAGGNWGSSTIDYADYLVRIFHEEGLKVGAWFEYGMAVGFPTHPIVSAHPDWLAYDKNNDPITGENGGFVFLSPGHPDAMQLLEDMCRELASNYDFDDIQIDRYRWGRKSTGREYGYEQATADLYQATYGVQPPNNVNNGQWVAFREGLVNAAVQRCYDAIKEENPLITVSSAPTGSYGITQHMQRWSAWLGGGYMDVVMPQMYMTSLGSFINEYNTQKGQAAGHLDKLAVGYRASDDTDWTLVRDQMNYARADGTMHGCLWVYHQYTGQIAIQDEIDNLPSNGQPWEELSYNPYVAPRMEQIIVDNLDPLYVENGGWSNSAQADFFRFNSRVAEGGADRRATFLPDVAAPAHYDVYVWYTAGGNRNPAAEVLVSHYGGVDTVLVDQTSGGGAWVWIGQWIFEADGTAMIELSTGASGAGVYTSADAVKLVMRAEPVGDQDSDGDADADDIAAFVACMTGPTNGAVPGGCEEFDFETDQDIDLEDVQLLQRVYTIQPQ